MLQSGRRRMMAVLMTAVFSLVGSGIITAGCGSGNLPSASGATAGNGGGGSGGASGADLNGAGATFPKPLYIEWIGEFQAINPNVKINYQGIGSGGGIEQFTQLTVDFGASDVPMTDKEILTAESAGYAEVLHIPTVFGAVVLAYNLSDVPELNLDAETLAAIFMGEVVMWDDPGIAALNLGVTLPEEEIRVVHRSDSSGTTGIFTGYLADVSAPWKGSVGSGKEVEWPVGVGGQGNDGVAAVIQQQSGSIGYVEFSYATESKLTMASLKNKAGNFIFPSLESTSAAAEDADFPEDLRFTVANSVNPEAYPIVGATWILAYQKMEDPAKARALKSWLEWCLNEGTVIAEELGYAPIPVDLKSLALAKVDAIGTF